MNRETV